MKEFKFYYFQNDLVCAECGWQLMVPSAEVTKLFVVLEHQVHPTCSFSGKRFFAKKLVCIGYPLDEGQVIQEEFKYPETTTNIPPETT